MMQDYTAIRGKVFYSKRESGCCVTAALGGEASLVSAGAWLAASF